ncbi:hypothetical protein [Paenibacillus sp. Marseille-Q4541]|uniref:hypothetical protein n=1 Tax=Paenibacillus sp. Marseille-Q4541 TaxID=2831522 RepID=UPI001BAAFBBA|nr:hypothetical protein [Paenibacillus sp. Marseille-Q4541]
MKKWFSTKRTFMVLMAFTLLFSTLAIPDNADARRGGGGFKSGTKSYQNNPSRSDSNSNSTSNTKNNSTNNTTGAAAKKPGFFSGGSLMKGLMIGGLAGMLFGGLFGNMGFFGELLGLAINILAIYVLVMLGVGIYRSIKKRRQENERARDINGGNGRY